MKTLFSVGRLQNGNRYQSILFVTIVADIFLMLVI